MDTRFAVALTADGTFINGTRYAAVEMPDNFGELIARLKKFNSLGEVTVLLDQAVALNMGIGAKLPSSDSQARNHPAFSAARDAGWNVNELKTWMTFWHREQTCVHVGLTQFFGKSQFPWFYPENMTITTARLADFHRLAGLPWRMTGGTTAIAMIRDTQARRVTPFWRPTWDGIEPALTRCEIPFRWVSECDYSDVEWMHGYDMNRQYLSAAQGAVLAVDQLVYHGRGEFNQLPGWWHITLPAWNDKRIPHPGGHGDVGDKVWRASPTMQLLMDMAEQGVCAEPEIHGSYTSQKSGRLLRPFAETVRDGLEFASTEYVEPERDIMRKMWQSLYKEGIGMLASPRSRILRYDWNHTIVSLARSNQWRRMWKIGQKENRWPSHIDVDTLWYASPITDPVLAVPEGLPLHNKLGGYKVVTTRENRPW